MASGQGEAVLERDVDEVRARDGAAGGGVGGFPGGELGTEHLVDGGFLEEAGVGEGGGAVVEEGGEEFCGGGGGVSGVEGGWFGWGCGEGTRQ